MGENRSMHWQTSRHLIDISRPRVMGIVNVTPDSFSDGGTFGSTRSAVAHCERLLAEGAWHWISGSTSSTTSAGCASRGRGRLSPLTPAAASA
jgi:dihydropteroate synthase